MKFPGQRLAQLFDALKNESLPQDELARRFAVSTRTVRADITSLNDILAEHGASLVLNRGEGYQLTVFDEERFRQLCDSTPTLRHSPRTSTERVQHLLLRFLTSAFALKLEDLADEWFISRATLQSDMAEVREWLGRYQLVIEARPRYGMKLFGSERAIRTCITDLLYAIYQENSENPLLSEQALNNDIFTALQLLLPQYFSRFHIRMAGDAELWIRLYCAITVKRIEHGYPLTDFSVGDVEEDIRQAARHIIRLISPVVGKAISSSEESFLQVSIAARRIQEVTASEINADDGEALVDYILNYISHHYNYHLQDDSQLREDLLTHVKTMITRVRYQITIPNPLLANIKQHYPLAYDVTLAAVTSWGKYTPYAISENETGFLVLHIGVGLERHYNVGYQRHPRILLVCDTGNSTLRMLESLLLRKYPQIKMERHLSVREYEEMKEIKEDFIISTARLSEKGKPIVAITPFPTDYQLEQIGKLVLIDRTRPYMLEKFFDQRHFMIVDQPTEQQSLFRLICQQLEREGYVDATFCPSVEEREAIVSTMLGEGIALPHSLGLLAKKTCVFTVLAPQGIQWGDDTAYVIFLLAISKDDYEEAMAIYDLFVTFMRERAMARLRDSTDFESFKSIAMECLSRL